MGDLIQSWYLILGMSSAPPYLASILSGIHLCLLVMCI